MLNDVAVQEAFVRANQHLFDDAAGASEALEAARYRWMRSTYVNPESLDETCDEAISKEAKAR